MLDTFGFLKSSSLHNPDNKSEEKLRFDSAIQNQLNEFSKALKKEQVERVDQLSKTITIDECFDLEKVIDKDSKLKCLKIKSKHLNSLYIFSNAEVKPFLNEMSLEIHHAHFLDKSIGDKLSKKLSSDVLAILLDKIKEIWRLEFRDANDNEDDLVSFKKIMLSLEKQIDAVFKFIKTIQAKSNEIDALAGNYFISINTAWAEGTHSASSPQEGIFCELNAYIKSITTKFLDDSFVNKDNVIEEWNSNLSKLANAICAANEDTNKILIRVDEISAYLNSQKNGIYKLVNNANELIKPTQNNQGIVQSLFSLISKPVRSLFKKTDGVATTKEIIESINQLIGELIDELQKKLMSETFALSNFFKEALAKQDYKITKSEINAINTHIHKVKVFLLYWTGKNNHFYELLENPKIEKYLLYDPLDKLSSDKKKLEDLMAKQSGSFFVDPDFLFEIRKQTMDIVSNVTTCINGYEKCLDEVSSELSSVTNDGKVVPDIKEFENAEFEVCVNLKAELDKDCAEWSQFLSSLNLEKSYTDSLIKVKSILNLDISREGALAGRFIMKRENPLVNDNDARCENETDYLIYLKSCQRNFKEGISLIESSIRSELRPRLEELIIKIPAQMKLIDECKAKINDCSNEWSSSSPFLTFKNENLNTLNKLSNALNSDLNSVQFSLDYLNLKSPSELLSIKNDIDKISSLESSGNKSEQEVAKISLYINQLKYLTELNVSAIDKQVDELSEKIKNCNNSIPEQILQIAPITFGNQQLASLECLRKQILDLGKRALSQCDSDFQTLYKTHADEFKQIIDNIALKVNSIGIQVKNALPLIKNYISALSVMNEIKNTFYAKWPKSNNPISFAKNSIFNIYSKLDADLKRRIEKLNDEELSNENFICDFGNYCIKRTRLCKFFSKKLDELSKIYSDLDTLFDKLVDEAPTDKLVVDLLMELSSIKSDFIDLVKGKPFYVVKDRKASLTDFSFSFDKIKNRYRFIYHYCNEVLNVSSENLFFSNQSVEVEKIINFRKDHTSNVNVCVKKIIEALEAEKSRCSLENQQEIVIDLCDKIKLERNLYQYALAERYVPNNLSNLSVENIARDYVKHIYNIIKDTLSKEVLRSISLGDNHRLWISQLLHKLLLMLEPFIERFNKLFDIKFPEKIQYCGFFPTQGAKNLYKIRELAEESVKHLAVPSA